MESAPFELLGLKCGSGDRRAGDSRPYRWGLPTSGGCSHPPLRGTWKLPLVWAGVCVPRGHPHPALRATFPLGGGRLTGGPVCRPYEIWETLRPFRWGRFQTGQRAHTVRPYGGKRAGSLTRQSQAQERNRISPKFPPAQAPSGAGRNRTQALLILRAGNFAELLRRDSRKTGPGERRL